MVVCNDFKLRPGHGCGKNPFTKTPNMTITTNTNPLRESMLRSRSDEVAKLIVMMPYTLVCRQSGYTQPIDRETTSVSDGTTNNFGDLTTAVDDANVVESSIPKKLSLVSSVLKSGSDGIERNRDILSFLATPHVLVSGNLSTTDIASTFPEEINGDTLWTSPFIYEKIKGFYSIRFDAVYTIEFNASRFQSGRYIFAFNPNGGGIAVNAALARAHRFSAVQVTQLPHVEFDLNCDSKAVLRVPFMSACNSQLIRNTTPTNNTGTVFLYPYSPLRVATGPTTVSYTIWIHYENVQLFHAAIPQSGRFKKSKPDVFEVETKTPPLSRTLDIISEVANSVAKIPMLTSIAAPLSWAADKAAGVARIFGFSKPPLLDPAHRMIREIVPYMGSSDNKSTATPLSLLSDNHVAIAPGFASTDMDELSIDFLKQISSFFAVVSWTTAQVPNTIVFNRNIGPQTFSVTQTDSTCPVTSVTPVCALGLIHAMWRGNVIIHFKLVKTEFHSGRLLVSFSPNPEDFTAPTPNVATNVQYIHKTIIDIRMGNEFSIEIPYADIALYRPTSFTDPRSITGVLNVQVLDRLVAPDTVPGDIIILAEVSGAPNLQFGFPQNPGTVPYAPITVQSGRECKLIETVVGSAKAESEDLSIFPSMALGESINSLRQHIKRGGFCYTTPVVGAGGVQVFPFVLGIALGNGTTTPDGLATVPRDPMNWIASFYTLSRGSVRIAFLNSSGASGNNVLVGTVRTTSGVQTNNMQSGSITATRAIHNTNYSASTIYDEKIGGAVVQVPQQSFGHSRSVYGNTFVGAVSTNADDRTCERTVLNVRTLGATTTPNYLFRSGGDDFAFGGFASIPPLFTFVIPA